MSKPTLEEKKHWLQSWRQLCKQAFGPCEKCQKQDGSSAQEECEKNADAILDLIEHGPEVSVSRFHHEKDGLGFKTGVRFQCGPIVVEVNEAKAKEIIALLREVAVKVKGGQ